jgi:hypothetical protein
MEVQFVSAMIITCISLSNSVPVKTNKNKTKFKKNLYVSGLFLSAYSKLEN